MKTEMLTAEVKKAWKYNFKVWLQVWPEQFKDNLKPDGEQKQPQHAYGQ